MFSYRRIKNSDNFSKKLIKDSGVFFLLKNKSDSSNSYNFKYHSSLASYKKNKEFNLMDSILRQRADYDKSAWLGKSVIEYDKESKAALEFRKLVKEIKNRVGLING